MSKVCQRGHDQSVHGYKRKDTGRVMCLACVYHCRKKRRAKEKQDARQA